jgi:hypothetical protein
MADAPRFGFDDRKNQMYVDQKLLPLAAQLYQPHLDVFKNQVTMLRIGICMNANFGGRAILCKRSTGGIFSS